MADTIIAWIIGVAIKNKKNLIITWAIEAEGLNSNEKVRVLITFPFLYVHPQMLSYTADSVDHYLFTPSFAFIKGKEEDAKEHYLRTSSHFILFSKFLQSRSSQGADHNGTFDFFRKWGENLHTGISIKSYMSLWSA